MKKNKLRLPTKILYSGFFLLTGLALFADEIQEDLIFDNSFAAPVVLSIEPDKIDPIDIGVTAPVVAIEIESNPSKSEAEVPLNLGPDSFKDEDNSKDESPLVFSFSNPIPTPISAETLIPETAPILTPVLALMEPVTSETIAKEPIPNEIQSTQEPEEEPKEAKLSSDSSISVDFPEEEIRNIIRYVADLYDLNVVVPFSLSGQASLRLRDVTWQQIFKSVLGPIGHTFIIDENIIYIKSISELAKEPFKTETVALSHAQAKSIIEDVRPFINEEEGGRISANVRSNSLLITERPSKFKEIKEVISFLDLPEPQIMIQAKFVNLAYKDNKGFELTNPLTSGITGYATGAKLTDTNKQEPMNYMRDRKTTGVEITGTAVLSASALSSTLKAYKEDSRTRVISCPNVVTMNNSPAMIEVVTETPLPKYEVNSDTGSLVLNGFEYKNIGISLNVIPSAKQNLVQLDINPEVSSQNGGVKMGNDASAMEIPIIDTSRAKSLVTIESGYTVAMGGLLKSTDGKSETKVPVLGNLPLFGNLFKSSSKKNEKTNLLMFITATIIDFDGSIKTEPKGTTVLNADERQLSELILSEDELPNYQIPEEEKRRWQELRTERTLKKNLNETQKISDLIAKTKKGKTEEESTGRRFKKKQVPVGRSIKRSSNTNSKTPINKKLF